MKNRTLLTLSFTLLVLLLLLLNYYNISIHEIEAIYIKPSNDLNQKPINHETSRGENSNLKKDNPYLSYQSIDVTKSSINDSYSSAIVVDDNVEEDKIVSKDQDDFEDSSELTQLQKAALMKSTKIIAKIRENCVAKNRSTAWSFWNKFTKPRLLIAKKEYHILYGSNPKTGSTSFKRFLFCLDGVTDRKHDFHAKPDGHYETVLTKSFFRNVRNFDNYVKITAIRNPIVRLVSAFRDKQLRNQRYFEPPPNITDTEHFALFVQYRLNSLDRWNIPLATLSIKEREQIALLAKSIPKTLLEEWDVHLMPQVRQINICRFPYDVVMQFEEISRYIPLIQKLTGTENVEYPGSRKEQGKDTQDSMEFVYQYWAGLNEDQRQIVLRKYDKDFKILGYTKLGEDGFPFLRFNDEIETS